MTYIKCPINIIKNANNARRKGKIIPALRDFDLFFIDLINKIPPKTNNGAATKAKYIVSLSILLNMNINSLNIFLSLKSKHIYNLKTLLI